MVGLYLSPARLHPKAVPAPLSLPQGRGGSSTHQTSHPHPHAKLRGREDDSLGSSPSSITTGCVTLSKSLNLSVPPSPSTQNGGDDIYWQGCGETSRSCSVTLLNDAQHTASASCDERLSSFHLESLFRLPPHLLSPSPLPSSPDQFLFRSVLPFPGFLLPLPLSPSFFILLVTLR